MSQTNRRLAAGVEKHRLSRTPLSFPESTIFADLGEARRAVSSTACQVVVEGRELVLEVLCQQTHIRQLQTSQFLVARQGCLDGGFGLGRSRLHGLLVRIAVGFQALSLFRHPGILFDAERLHSRNTLSIAPDQRRRSRQDAQLFRREFDFAGHSVGSDGVQHLQIAA